MSERAAEYKAQVLAKIDRLLSEFAEGKVSREQFYAIYEHYNKRLALAESLDSADADVNLDGSPGATIAIRQAHMGKALGMVIYHSKSGTFVETLGEFDVPPVHMASTLNDFALMMETDRLIDRRVLKLPDSRWLLFCAGKFTTVVVLFHHEPSPQQMREVERLHHDFEQANVYPLRTAHAVDSSALAYPFVVILQQKLKLR